MQEPNDNFPDERAPTTNRLLKFVKNRSHEDLERTLNGENGGGGHGSNHGGEEHEEQIHVDERWLIAYADKMTLLAGLFIMLFAMSTLDKVKFQKVKESAEKSFGKPVDEAKAVVVDVTELNKSIEELKKNKQELEVAKQSEVQLKKKIEQIQKELESKNADKLQIVEAQKKIQVLVEQIEAQARQLTALRETQAQTEKKIPKVDPQAKMQELLKQIKTQEVKIETLETELVQAKAAAATGSFLAFVMSWPTKNHDIDLKVEDPQGKVFDFKHRQFGSAHPGLFVLDTRQGPGAEIWQADKIFPGVYKFTFNFYNQQGNPEPCPITAKIFTPKGSVEVPLVTLDAASKRSHTAKIKLDEAGQASLVK